MMKIFLDAIKELQEEAERLEEISAHLQEISDAIADVAEDCSDADRVDDTTATSRNDVTDNVICMYDPEMQEALDSLFYVFKDDVRRNRIPTVMLSTFDGDLCLVGLTPYQAKNYKSEKNGLMAAEVKNDMIVLHALSADTPSDSCVYAVVDKDDINDENYCVTVIDDEENWKVENYNYIRNSVYFNWVAGIDKIDTSAVGYFIPPTICFKITKPDYTCRGAKYEAYTNYAYEGEVEIHKSGIHFTSDPGLLLSWYKNVTPDFHIFKVQVSQCANVKKDMEKDIYVTNDIVIGEEIPFKDVMKMTVKEIENTIHETPMENSADDTSDDDKEMDISYVESIARTPDSVRKAFRFEGASEEKIEGFVAPTYFGDVIIAHVPHGRIDDIVDINNNDDIEFMFSPVTLTESLKIHFSHECGLEGGTYAVLPKKQERLIKADVEIRRAVFTTAFKAFDPFDVFQVYKHMKDKERFSLPE